MTSGSEDEISRQVMVGFQKQPWSLDRTYDEIHTCGIKVIHSAGHGFIATFKDRTTLQDYAFKYFFSGDYVKELKMMLYAGSTCVPVVGRVWVPGSFNQQHTVNGFIMPLLIPLASGNGPGEPNRVIRPQLSNFQKKSIIYKIKNAVKRLHQKGIIHGDLKPSNILLTNTQDVKLCDLAESTFTAKAITPRAVSAPYLSSYRCKCPTAPLLEYDDIYALGTSAWEIWTEKIPFNELDEEEIENEIKKGTQPSLNSITDPEIQELIQSLWLGKLE